jgi:hypothetical protein
MPSRKRRSGRGGRGFDLAPEQQTEPRAARAELRRGAERQVDLQAARQQEHAVDQRLRRQVEEVDGAERVGELARPVGQHPIDPLVAGDAERQVDVRPAVAAVAGQRADRGAGDHPGIGCCHPKDVVAHALAIGDGEHAAPRTSPQAAGSGAP